MEEYIELTIDEYIRIKNELTALTENNYEIYFFTYKDELTRRISGLYLSLSEAEEMNGNIRVPLKKINE